MPLSGVPGPRGFAHYFEVSGYERRCIRPYLSDIRRDDYGDHPLAPIFVDIYSLPDLSSFKEACAYLVGETEGMPVVAPRQDVLPTVSLRPEKQRAKAFVGITPTPQGQLISMIPEDALLYIPPSQPPEDPSTLRTLLNSIENRSVRALYVPSPASLAASADVLDSIHLDIERLGAAIIYSTDPDDSSLQAISGNTAFSIVARAFRAIQWRVELKPASKASALQDRKRASIRCNDDGALIEFFVPAGFQAMDVAHLLGRELLWIEGYPRISSLDGSEEERYAADLLSRVLADDILRRRFGTGQLPLNMGLHHRIFRDEHDKIINPSDDPILATRLAAAVLEILCLKGWYNEEQLIGMAESISPYGVRLARSLYDALRSIENPKDPEMVISALQRVASLIPLRSVRIVRRQV